MTNRQFPRGMHGQIVRALLSLVALAKGEAQRSGMAMQRRMFCSEFGEPSRGSEEDSLSDEFAALDFGLYSALASSAMSYINAFDASDHGQLSEVRGLLILGQELCRERLEQRSNPKSASARSWRFFGNQFAAALRRISEADRSHAVEYPLPRNEFPNQVRPKSPGRFDQRFPFQGDVC